MESGGRLNIEMSSYQYRDPHVKDKTVASTVLSLTWESPYLGKTVFILRRGPDCYMRSCSLAFAFSISHAIVATPRSCTKPSPWLHNWVSIQQRFYRKTICSLVPFWIWEMVGRDLVLDQARVQRIDAKWAQFKDKLRRWIWRGF